MVGNILRNAKVESLCNLLLKRMKFFPQIQNITGYRNPYGDPTTSEWESVIMRFSNFWGYRRIWFSKSFASALWHSRQNLLAYGQGRPLAAGPYMAALDVTYRCNCRCQMCQRWKDPCGGELSVDETKKLAGVLCEMGSHQFSIAGGEPLLRDDVFTF